MKNSNIDNAMIGKYCIVRGSEFGVFAGTVGAVDGDKALLKNARRLWYWDGAASLSQMAAEGVKRPENCKFTMPVESVLLFGVIEIIPATEAAQENIAEVPEWRR